MQTVVLMKLDDGSESVAITDRRLRVHRHTMTLAVAQAAIARNWTDTPVGLPAK